MSLIEKYLWRYLVREDGVCFKEIVSFKMFFVGKDLLKED